MSRTNISPTPRQRNGVSLAVLINGLDARKSGDQWVARCPAPGHEDKKPSFAFTVKGERLLLHCRSPNCAWSDIVEGLSDRGLWPVEIDEEAQPPPQAQAVPQGLPPELIAFDAKLVCARGTRVERYLAARGIALGDLTDIMMHPRALHGPTGTTWPAMVAAIRDCNGQLRSLHRTFLTHGVEGAKAPIDPVRMVWSRVPVKGCAIHLAPAAEAMLIAEGIETTASAMALFGLGGWAAIGSNLRHVILPDLVRDVVIAADNDAAGLRAAKEAAQRFKREGREVKVIKPSGHKDFNDLLLARG